MEWQWTHVLKLKMTVEISVSQWNDNQHLFISHDGYFIFSSSWRLTLWDPIGWTTAYTQSWPILSLFARWDDRSWEPECPLSPALMELSLSTPLLVLGKIFTPMFLAIYSKQRVVIRTEQKAKVIFSKLKCCTPCVTLTPSWTMRWSFIHM